MLGLFDRLNLDVKAEMQSKKELKAKLEESLKRNESSDVALKAAEVKNKKLERRMDDLIDSREELQKCY